MAPRKRPAAAALTAPSYSDRFQVRVGSGLSPQLITAVQRQADLGYMDRWADLLDEIRQADTHLQAELGKYADQVVGAPIEVRPGSVGTRAKKAAGYCQELLDTLEVPPASLALSFREALAHLLTAAYHGRAALETVWARDGRALRPARVEWVHARRLAYAAHDWKLHVWDATSGDTRFAAFPGVPVDDPEVFPRGKLVLHTPRVFGTYPTREGLGRCLVWYAAFKRWTIRDWMAFAEWAGRGLRVGTFATGRDPQNPAEASDEDQATLRDALTAMSSSVATVLADTTQFSLIPAPPNQEVHERLTLLCNAEISKAVLGGTLSAEPGERGARSLGEVQERGQLRIAARAARPLAEAWRRDFFAPAVRERYGDNAAVPELAIVTDSREAQDSLVGRVDKLAGRGLRIGAAWVRGQLGMPDPEPGEETLGGAPEPEPNADPAADGAGPPAPGKKPGKKKPTPADAEE